MRSGLFAAGVAAVLWLVAPAFALATPTFDMSTDFHLRLDGAAASDLVGRSVSGAGDVNGDGRPDLVVGASAHDSSAGAAYVVFGAPPPGTLDLGALGAQGQGFSIDGAQTSGRAGISVAGAGDVNGDGLEDVVVGADRVDLAAGSAYVVFGKGTFDSVDLGALGGQGFEIRGAASSDFLGYAVDGAGDVNGDGLADVVVGAHRADTVHGMDAGAAYVVFGKQDSTDPVDVGSLGAQGFAIFGAGPDYDTGLSVAGAGYVNDDGLADVIVGADDASFMGRPGAGTAYVVFGKPLMDTDPVDLAALTGGFEIGGEHAVYSTGESVDGAGDMNGDGRADLIVGAPLADGGPGGDSGFAYVVPGKSSTGAVDLYGEPGAQGVLRIDGANGGDLAGNSVAGAGDVNGDDRADVIVGAPWTDYRERKYSGSAYVVFGRATGGVVELGGLGGRGMRIDGAATWDSLGDTQGAAGIGDWNGDGLADVLTGADNADGPHGSNSGAAYVVLGCAMSRAPGGRAPVSLRRACPPRPATPEPR